MCKKKKKIKVVGNKKKNRSTYYEQKKVSKRILLAFLIVSILFFIVSIPFACWLIFKSESYDGIKGILGYIGLPISVLGASVITVIMINMASSQKNFSPRNVFIFLFVSVLIMYVTEMSLIEDGVNLLFSESTFNSLLMGRLIISIIGSMLIGAIDVYFRSYFKDPHNPGVLPIGKRRKLLIHLNRTKEYFKTEKETRLFEIGKSDGKQFGEEVNQYINDILKEYRVLSEVKLLQKQPELEAFCTKKCKHWNGLRKYIKGKSCNEVIGLISSEQYKDIEEFNEVMKNISKKRSVNYNEAPLT